MPRTRLIPVLIAAQMTLGRPGLSQNPAKQPARRWEVSAQVGASFGGNSGQFEDVMRSSGFGDPEPCFLFCIGAVTNPHSKSAGWMTDLAVSYALRTGLRLRLERMSAGLGATYGFHAPLTFLRLQPSVTTVSAAVLVNLSPRMRIGAGPAVGSVEVRQTDSPGGPPSRARRAGFILLGSLVSSSRSRVFAEFTAHYVVLASARVGPFVGHDLGSNAPTEMPQMRVWFRYLALHAGLGLRF